MVTLVLLATVTTKFYNYNVVKIMLVIDARKRIDILMQFPCETIVREVLPAFKAHIVKELFHKYNFTQSKIANLLNITQASVSYYLHGERGNIGSDLIQKHKNIKELLTSLTEDLATEAADPEIITNKVCELCANMHEEFGCKGAQRK